jgi:Ca-activated chloride channel family protein
MQRWHLTTGLAASALLAAIFVPSLVRQSARVAPVTPQTAPPSPLNDSVATSGDLHLEAGLDQDALLQSSGEDRFLVVEISADDVGGIERLPVHLAVVMDTSGSMGGKGKITNARMAASELAGLLSPDDTMSLVTFDDQAEVLFKTSGTEDASRMARLIAGINPGGGTNIYDGLTQGQALLSDDSIEGVKRVVLLSDGMANLGVTDPTELARISGSLASEGISVSGLGLGLDYNEDLLAAMSDAGGGGYHFVDRPGQLTDIFSAELAQMGAIAGRGTTLDVELAPGVELLEVYGYDAALDADGYSVFLGDVYGSSVRKVVARVRVDDQALGDVDIAGISLRYTDPADNRALSTAAAVDAEITANKRLAASSIDARRGSAAASAAAAKMLEDGARALQSGNKSEATAQLEQGEAMLRQFSERYDAPVLEEMADDFAAQQVEFSSAAEGHYQVKKAKESARGYSRY